VRLSVILFLIAACLLGTWTQAMAAPGDLDSSFSFDGKVVTDIQGMDNGIGGVVIQPDGKIVVAGGIGSDPAQVLIARYSGSGQLDPTFGQGGSVATNLPGGGSAGTLILQPDGKILVAGVRTVGSDEDFLLMRFLSDGTPDSTFGVAGVVTTDLIQSRGEDLSGASGLALQPDGKIVVAGTTRTVGGWVAKMAVTRYQPDGSLDQTFDGDGRRLVGFGRRVRVYGNDMALQDDGKLLLAGSASGSGYTDFALARLTSSGGLDPGFGEGGRVHTPVGASSALANGVTVQEDGKVVAVGDAYVDPGYAHFGMARYLPNGALDATFDGDGTKIVEFGATTDDVGHDVAVQADGKIVVAGGSASDFGLVRLNSGGGLDMTFNRDGRLLTDFGGLDTAGAIALQSDGRLVVGGWTYGATGQDFALARYLAS
jgi:uncharacterized delta-60 repeat protein